MALFKIASVKKVVKLKRWPRNGCDGTGLLQKFNQFNLCCLIPASLGTSTNSPKLLLLNFCHQPCIPSQQFLGCPL